MNLGLLVIGAALIMVGFALAWVIDADRRRQVPQGKHRDIPGQMIFEEVFPGTPPRLRIVLAKNQGTMIYGG